MCLLKFFVLVPLLGIFCFFQVLEGATMTPPKARHLRNIFSLRPVQNSKQIFQLPPFATPKKPLNSRINVVPQSRQIQRRDVPFQQPFLGVPVQIENVQAAQPQAPMNNLYPMLPKLPTAPKPLVKPNETEAERAERIHKSFDRLLTFVEIVGQVDNYVSSKWKNLVKTVSNFYETEDEPYRVGAKQIYGTCPHAH